MVTVRGLLELVCATSRGQIVQSVMPVLNLSVWYSIKIASKFEGVFTALLIMTGELLLLFGIFFSVSLITVANSLCKIVISETDKSSSAFRAFRKRQGIAPRNPIWNIGLTIGRAYLYMESHGIPPACIPEWRICRLR